MEQPKDYTPEEIEARERYGYWPIIGIAIVLWLVILLVSIAGSEVFNYIYEILRGL